MPDVTDRPAPGQVGTLREQLRLAVAPRPPAEDDYLVTRGQLRAELTPLVEALAAVLDRIEALEGAR